MKNQLAYQTSTAVALCKTIEQWRKNYEEFSLEIISDAQIQQYLSDWPNTEGMEPRHALYEYSGNKMAIREIYIIDKGYNLIGTGPNNIKPYIFDRISTAERFEGSIVWDSGYDTTSVVLYRKIFDQLDDINESIGYLFLVIDIHEVHVMFDDYRLDRTQRFALNGIGNGFEISERGFFYKYYDKFFDLLHSEINFRGWKLRTWTDKSVVLVPTKDTFAFLVLVLIFAFIAAIISILFLSARITKQISIMRETVKKFGIGQFDARIEIVQNDEIGRLATTLNKMAEQIQALIQEVNIKERQKRKLQLQTFEYQINPHFLYNTLDSINMLARKDGDSLVADMVTSLSKLFRLGLHKGEEFIPVSDEVLHLYYYLRIQSIRFENQFTWKIEVDSEINDLLIIKFILQPLAENAINHGLRKKTTHGHLTIKGWRDENIVYFSIHDDGIGIASEKLSEIKKSLNSESFNAQKIGFGLNNVNQRIKLRYGRDYDLNIESIENVGTNICVALPILSP
ncbi:MAG: sensor histidine kinase [Holosporaceae bacterium]|nr:sensor histidine kinase [Holosporaceae bacterium]